MENPDFETPTYERIARRKRHAFQLGHLSINEIKRLNKALLSEISEREPEDDDKYDRASGEAEDSLENAFQAAISGLAEDGDLERAREIVTALQHDDDASLQISACVCAYYLAPLDYDFASDILLERYENSDYIADTANEYISDLKKRVTAEQAVDLEMRRQQARAARLAAGKDT